MIETISPVWTPAGNVEALFTLRAGGASQGSWQGLNLATHVGDDPLSVHRNRALLRQRLPAEPCWLNQVHSTHCLDLDHAAPDVDADASITGRRGVVLSILVADCLAILLASSKGDRIAAIHAGWRGLADGIIAETVRHMQSQDLVAWLSPAIGPCHYEVGDDVRNRFDTPRGFTRTRDRWRMDLADIARLQLSSAGVSAVYGGGDCTHCDSERFYSFRRDGVTGRMAALIWLT